MSKPSRNRAAPGPSPGPSGAPVRADRSEPPVPADPSRAPGGSGRRRSSRSSAASRGTGASSSTRGTGTPRGKDSAGTPRGKDPAGSGSAGGRARPPRNPGGGSGAEETPGGGSAGVDPRDAETAEAMLKHGRITVEGRLVAASNATLYCSLEWEGLTAACVYKPVAGERPLWDFPDGTLAGREVAAYQVSKAMGWRVVPPTVHRDGPYGPGMVQLWIETDESTDVVALSRANDPAVRRMAVFDAVVNNADRKIGHLLPPGDGHVFGCDHGVCFSIEYKLRTVLWQWRGKRLTDEAVDGLSRLLRRLDRPQLPGRLARLLTPAEIEATRRRIELMLKHRIHPYPPEDWPAIPWPPL